MPFICLDSECLKTESFAVLRCVKKVKLKSLRRVRLFETPWTVAYQAPQSVEFSRQEYWSGLPFPSPADLPDSGTEPGSPALQADALPLSQGATKEIPIQSVFSCVLWSPVDAHRSLVERTPACTSLCSCFFWPLPPCLSYPAIILFLQGKSMNCMQPPTPPPAWWSMSVRAIRRTRKKTRWKD